MKAIYLKFPLNQLPKVGFPLIGFFSYESFWQKGGSMKTVIFILVSMSMVALADVDAGLYGIWHTEVMEQSPTASLTMDFDIKPGIIEVTTNCKSNEETAVARVTAIVEIDEKYIHVKNTAEQIVPMPNDVECSVMIEPSKHSYILNGDSLEIIDEVGDVLKLSR
jgi:hypothetical protein